MWTPFNIPRCEGLASERGERGPSDLREGGRGSGEDGGSHLSSLGPNWALRSHDLFSTVL